MMNSPTISPSFLAGMEQSKRRIARGTAAGLLEYLEISLGKPLSWHDSMLITSATSSISSTPSPIPSIMFLTLSMEDRDARIDAKDFPFPGGRTAPEEIGASTSIPSTSGETP